jgi:hypothetical protein
MLVPFTDIRAGRFRRSRLVDVPVVRRPGPRLTLALDRSVQDAGYDVVAVGVEDPAAVAAEKARRRG